MPDGRASMRARRPCGLVAAHPMTASGAHAGWVLVAVIDSYRILMKEGCGSCARLSVEALSTWCAVPRCDSLAPLDSGHQICPRLRGVNGPCETPVKTRRRAFRAVLILLW